MSLEAINSNILRYKKDIANITQKESEQLKKESAARSKVVNLQKRLSARNLSSTTINSIYSQLASENKIIADCDDKLAKLATSKCQKQKSLANEEAKLAKEQDRIRKQLEKESKKQVKNQQQQIDKINISVATLFALQSEDYYESIEEIQHNDRNYDFFISHASEDKETFVRPLAQALMDAGCSVWFDETALKPGDSLRTSLDKGMVDSRYGIVVISPNFIKKRWTEYELNGMVSKEMNGHKVIIPVWFNVTKDDVLHYSPTLADKLAIDASRLSLDEVVNQAKSVLQNK